MPAIPSEFEEKEFEGPLYNQLEHGTRLVWPPGQVFEQYVGFDRALFLSDPRLWGVFGVSSIPPGVFFHRFRPYFWPERPTRKIPTFRMNLFIQSKRSYFYRRLPKQIRGKLTGSTCWQFKIDESQQEALGRVARKLARRAFVCYAAPAFHKMSELTAHTSRGSILKNSTFPQAARLDGHEAFYYCSPGGSGVANPNPEEIEGPGLEDLLGNVVSGTDSSAQESVTGQLVALANDIEATIAEEVPDTNPRKALFTHRRNELLALLEDFEQAGESARAFMRVRAFVSAFNLDWYAVV